MKLPKGATGALKGSAVQDLARAVLGRETVREVAGLLGKQGIPIMPLKGILLQQLIYPNPSERRISDVDLLVRSEHFPTAVLALCQFGFRPVNVARSLIEIAFRAPNGMTVDLHRQLFSPYRYNLETSGLFDRSFRNETLFGVEVSLLEPLDLLAHLIGKWVSDHVSGQPAVRLRDLERLVAHYEISPRLAAKHFEVLGLSRAARYVLKQVAPESEPFFCETLRFLPADPVGELCSALAAAIIPLQGGGAISAFPAHLLNSSIPHAGLSAGAVGLRRGIHWYLHCGHGPAPAYLRSCIEAVRDSEIANCARSVDPA